MVCYGIFWTVKVKVWVFGGLWFINPRTYTQSHTPTVAQGGWWGGGGVDETSSLSFQWKAFDLLYKRKYILLVVALLEAYDVSI